MARFAIALIAFGMFASFAAAQVTRTDVTNTPNHLTMNGLMAKTDGNETDFLSVDIDMDGDKDVIIARKTPFTSSVNPLPNVLLINDGAGHMTDETANLTQFNANVDRSREVLSGDLNNDGWPDVIVFNTENEPTKIYYNLGNNAQGIWLGLGVATNIGSTGNFNFCSGALLDYNVDGWLDIYRVDYSSGANPSAHGDDLLEQSSATPGTFSNVISLIPAMVNPQGATGIFPFEGNQVMATDMNFGARAQARLSDGSMLDINMDGNVDIFVSGREKTRATYSDGMGGFLISQEFSSVSGNTYDGSMRDINNDGRPDVMKVEDGFDGWSANLSTLPDGSIVESANEVVGAGSSSNGFGANSKLVDWDGDGNVDVFVFDVDIDISNCGFVQGAKLFLGDPAGSRYFTQNTALNMGAGIFDAAIDDFDGDGILDFLGSDGCGGSQGIRYFVSDPNALADVFESEFVPNGAGLDFNVSNVPVHSGNFRRLYNLFSLDLSQPLGAGPILGMPRDIIGQFAAGAPFNNVIGINQTSFSFFIPPVVVNLGLDVRTMSIAVDPGLGIVDLTEIYDEISPNP